MSATARSRSRIARHALFLLALASGTRAVAAHRADDGVAALAAKLEDPSEETRRDAVAALAQLATPAAWNLVVEALPDPSSLVGDEIQVRLGDAKEASLAKALTGKSGLGSSDRQVRLRVAEALGRVQFEVDGVALCKLLSDKDPELRSTIAWTIERLAEANRIEKKSRSFVKQQLDQCFKKDQDPGVRASVLQARHAVEPLTVSDLFEALAKKDAGVVRASATQLLGRVQRSQILGLFDDTLEDEELCAKRALVNELVRNPTRTTVQSLAAVLNRETTHLRLGWTIVGHLQEFSGQNAEFDKLHWMKWMRGLDDDWKPPSPKNAGKATDHASGARATILGQPLLSDRVTILVDVSPALVELRADGKSRRFELSADLRRALEKASDAHFNLIVYGREAAAFEKALVPASAANVKRALKFLDDAQPNGSGNVFEALQLASLDPKVDTLLVVTDAAPRGARHVDVQLLADLIAQRNRFRQLYVDALVTAQDPKLLETWKMVCASSGGRAQAATLE